MVSISISYPYQLPVLSLHEGEPGHHLQGAYALASTHLPDFRRYIEDNKYYLFPAKFPLNAAYVEVRIIGNCFVVCAAEDFLKTM